MVSGAKLSKLETENSPLLLGPKLNKALCDSDNVSITVNPSVLSDGIISLVKTVVKDDDVTDSTNEKVGVWVNVGVKRETDVVTISTKEEVGGNISKDDVGSGVNVLRDGATKDEDGEGVVELEELLSIVVEGVTLGENNMSEDPCVVSVIGEKIVVSGASIEVVVIVEDSCVVSIGFNGEKTVVSCSSIEVVVKNADPCGVSVGVIDERIVVVSKDVVSGGRELDTDSVAVI